jgi:hypothetical protein
VIYSIDLNSLVLAFHHSSLTISLFFTYYVQLVTLFVTMGNPNSNFKSMIFWRRESNLARMTFCAVCQHWKSWTCLIKVSLSWSCVRFIPPYCSISSKDAPILGVSFWAFKPPHVCLDYYVLISNLYVMFIFPITKLCVFYFRELHMNMQWSWSIWPYSRI